MLPPARPITVAVLAAMPLPSDKSFADCISTFPAVMPPVTVRFPALELRYTCPPPAVASTPVMIASDVELMVMAPPLVVSAAVVVLLPDVMERLPPDVWMVLAVLFVEACRVTLLPEVVIVVAVLLVPACK